MYWSKTNLEVLPIKNSKYEYNILKFETVENTKKYNLDSIF